MGSVDDPGASRVSAYHDDAGNFVGLFDSSGDQALGYTNDQGLHTPFTGYFDVDGNFITASGYTAQDGSFISFGETSSDGGTTTPVESGATGLVDSTYTIREVNDENGNPVGVFAYYDATTEEFVGYFNADSSRVSGYVSPVTGEAVTFNGYHTLGGEWYSWHI